MHARILHMRRDHGEIVDIERNQFELGRHRNSLKSLACALLDTPQESNR
jgi:hypothetical protein